MSMTRDVVVPNIGDFKNIPVIEILVKPGDSVRAEDPLVTLESEKATMEVPAPFAGLVTELLVVVGSDVSEGTPLLRLEALETSATQVVGAASVQAATLPQKNLPEPSTESAAIPTSTPAQERPIGHDAVMAHASPSVRAFARELGLDLNQVVGNGPKGRILRQDLLAFAKSGAINNAPRGEGSAAQLPQWPQVDFSKFGPIERQPLSRLRKIAGLNLARNWVTIPHVTNFDEADVTDLEAFRISVNDELKASGVKLTMLAFLITAAVSTLKAFPEFNASLENDTLVLKRYYHVGFAADTTQGLMVPVIHDADKKGLLEIARGLAELARQAREGKLKLSDAQGGCFSISSLGGIGGTGFTPIINAPEVAILGAAKAQTKPRWDGAQFCPRLILPLSLSWDHRVVDGAEAARFLNHLVHQLADFRRVLL